MSSIFPYESELDAVLEADLEESLTIRKQAADLVRIARGWVARIEEAPSGFVNRITDLERAVTKLNAETRERWRSAIRGSGAEKHELRSAFNRYTTYRPEATGNEHLGFDELDLLLDCLMQIDPEDESPPDPGEELVHYEPAPARAVLEMIDRTGLESGKVFYDVGSGLGRANLLVSLLTPARSVGVDIDHGLVGRARRVVDSLGLSDKPVFIHADACEIDLSSGEVFFLFSPFYGRTLERFLDKLTEECPGSTVCSYGNCTRAIHSHPMMVPEVPGEIHPFKVVLFAVGGAADRPVFEERHCL
jgi:predicted RNA methylase